MSTPILVILAAAGVVVVFLIVFFIVQWSISRATRNGPHAENAQVRRTLENAAQTFGGGDYLRLYPPPEEQNRATPPLEAEKEN